MSEERVTTEKRNIVQTCSANETQPRLKKSWDKVEKVKNGLQISLKKYLFELFQNICFSCIPCKYLSFQTTLWDHLFSKSPRKCLKKLYLHKRTK